MTEEERDLDRKIENPSNNLMKKESAKVHGGGRVVIPKPIRDKLGIHDGDVVAFRYNSRIELLAMSIVEPKPH